MSSEQINSVFGGKWKGGKSENLENVLKEMDINVVKRKAAINASPTLQISADGENVKVKIEAMIKTVEANFVLNTEVALNEDGKDFKAIATYADGKLTVVSTPVDTKLHPVTVTREVVNGELVQTMTCNGVTGKRIFTKV